MSKRGQVSVFVIIALMIVVILAIILTINLNKNSGVSVNPSEDPKGYIQDCAIKATKEAELNLIPSGGFLKPQNSIYFDNTNVTWMCYTPFNEQLCMNKHPLLTGEIEDEIRAIITPKIEACFSKLKTTFKNNDYIEGSLTVNPLITDGFVKIEVRKKISIKKQDNSLAEFENFDSVLLSPLYNFVQMENRIIREELLCDCTQEICNADIFDLNGDNRNFETIRFVTGKNEKIYTIEEISTKKQFNFAVRNCVRLP
ncbi:MAG: hypothetical protein Q8L27_04490 [archaeon]|nr:hypothetical protein [archaeon]